jgi:3',5'-cyclic-AMP phosphodiesterase
MSNPITFLVPGDLHLTQAGLANHQTALWMVEQANGLVRPDFVQFIGDNVQHARDDEFALFADVRTRLTMPHYVLPGDHDVFDDPQASRFRQFVGDPVGQHHVGDFCFLRLNTVECSPVGLADDQIEWFHGALAAARAKGRRVVVFQHHYPYKVYEEFAGPGIEAWREAVRRQRLVAIFAGHTHYSQIANDGRTLSIATRSIGDPEGGPPGFLLAYLHDEDLAVKHRAVTDLGPLVLITHPRDLLLATGHEHIVTATDEVRVRVWSEAPIATAEGRFDREAWSALRPTSRQEWRCDLPIDRLVKGRHRLMVRARDEAGDVGTDEIMFLFDPSGRYTPLPRSHPEVVETEYC